MKRRSYRIVFLMAVFMAVIVMGSSHKVNAETKKYGIMIADSKGSYSFYDLNGTAGNPRLEKSENNKLMVPLRKVCSYMEKISYSYDFSSNTATVINERTKTKLIFTKGSKKVKVYAKGSKTYVTKSMNAEVYLSSESNAAMVPMAGLKYALKEEKGYHYFGIKETRQAGYDCSFFAGIVVYNPYKKVTSLSDSTKVSYISDKSESNIEKVLIPEGLSVTQIVTLLVNKGVCVSSSAMYHAMNRVDYKKYSMFEGRNMNEHICFPLEGYLFPDTYQFYKNSEPSEILAKLLQNSDKKLSVYKKKLKKGETLDDLIGIASIIEKESKDSDSRKHVSSILHNRLDISMKLQCDATINYVERYVKPYLTEDKDRYNSYYNTYKCAGLPAGPICNPGSKALDAALKPMKSKDLFFFSDQKGNYYYFDNYADCKKAYDKMKNQKSDD